MRAEPELARGALCSFNTPKCRIRPPFRCTSVVLFTEYDCSKSVHPMGDHNTFALEDNSIRPAFQRMSTLKNKSICLPILAYVHTKRQTKRQIFKMPF
jgi:hypothetical protein